jgi:MFS family permease
MGSEGGGLGSLREVLRGNVLILTLGTIIRQLSLFITFPFFSLYVRALGGSNVAIGLVNALRPLAAMFIYPIAGALADNYGRVKILVLTGFVNAALFAIYMLAPDWRFLAAANFINGLLVFRFPTSSALLADSMAPGLRGRGFAAVTAIPGFVGILSPFIGGYLTEVLGLTYAMRLLYGVTLVALMSITLINMKYLEETLPRPHSSRSDLPQIVQGAYKKTWEILRWMPRELRSYAIILVIALFFNSLTAPYWVVYAQDALGIRKLDWGSILTISTVIQVILAIPAGNLIDRYDKGKLTALALCLSALPSLAFPFCGGLFGVMLVLLPISVANAFLIPASGALMADMVPRERRGITMATLGRGYLLINYRGDVGSGPGMGFILTFPVIIGSLFGGYIYEISPPIPWLLLGAAQAVNTVLAAFFLRTEKTQKQ